MIHPIKAQYLGGSGQMRALHSDPKVLGGLTLSAAGQIKDKTVVFLAKHSANKKIFSPEGRRMVIWSIWRMV